MTTDQMKKLSNNFYATTLKSLSSQRKKSNLTNESKDEIINKNIREIHHFDKSAASLQSKSVSKSALNINTGSE